MGIKDIDIRAIAALIKKLGADINSTHFVSVFVCLLLD
jgi:hypothetical protein